MPLEIVLMKTATGALVPVDQAGQDYIARQKIGAGFTMTARRNNNVKFHRKLFALANLAFDAWDAPAATYRGQAIQKNFDQFRDDLTILAGYYETRVRLDGSIRLIPRSWSFGAMDDDQKEKMYSAIIDVVLQRILTDTTRDDLENLVAQVMAFT